MPTKDPQPSTGTGGRTTKSRPTRNIVHDEAGHYDDSRKKAFDVDEALHAPASVPRLYQSNHGSRPEAQHLQLSEENLRKLEISTESGSYSGAYMRTRGSLTKKDKRKEKEDR